jgi:thiol-disulfide isomerase/thioredoxin
MHRSTVRYLWAFAVLALVCCPAAYWLLVYRPGVQANLSEFSLEAEYSRRLEHFRQTIKTGASQDERAAVSKEFSTYSSGAFKEMLAIATKQPSSEVGKRAALWVVSNCDADYEPHRQAAAILLTHHSCSQDLGAAYIHLTGFHPVYERLLRIGAASNTDRTARGYASFELADLLTSRAAFRDEMNATPELDGARLSNMGSETVSYLKSTNRDSDRNEARVLFQAVRSEYGDLAYRDRTLGSVAADRLLAFEQTYPEIGKVAQDIVGRDLNGNKLTLSAYRGKVVVVTFWASWCGACLGHVPEENQLIEKFSDSPFVFLGVNVDASRQDGLAAVKQHSIGFRSWWDNPDADDAIAHRWAVHEFPTTFVLDESGVIRCKNLYGKDLRIAVERLLTDGK